MHCTAAMLSLSVSTDIDATARAVWETLTDLAGFHDWNPFIRRAEGLVAVGEEIHVHLRPWRALPIRFRARVTVCEPDRQLRWRGASLAPWIGSGDHTFLIEDAGRRRVRLVQREVFTGVLPLVGVRLLERHARAGFEAMNQALKARVEGAAARASVRAVS
jgi:hypothetical protein